jgi:hypothetical protein
MSIVAELVLEQAVNGLLVGSFYITLSLGLLLIFSLGGVVNLAHGALLRCGRLPGQSRSVSASSVPWRCRSWAWR